MSPTSRVSSSSADASYWKMHLQYFSTVRTEKGQRAKVVSFQLQVRRKNAHRPDTCDVLFAKLMSSFGIVWNRSFAYTYRPWLPVWRTGRRRRRKRAEVGLEESVSALYCSSLYRPRNSTREDRTRCVSQRKRATYKKRLVCFDCLLHHPLILWSSETGARWLDAP